MKKTLWLVLVLILVCVLTLSACDNGTNQPQNPNTEQSTNQSLDNNGGSTDTDNTQSPTIDNTECQHTFDNWKITKQATCNEAGELVRTCSKCFNMETVTIEKNEAHTEVIDEAVPATCTKTGLTEGKHCSVCNIVLIAQTTVKTKAHTEVIDKAVPATCVATGKTQGKHCSVCNSILVAQTTVKKASHQYVSGICSICNDNTRDFSGGNGTADRPYLISSFAQLNNIRLYPNAHFLLTSNLTGSGYWTPIDEFKGVLDGDNHKIYNLKVNNTYAAGLFSTNYGTITNLSIVNSSISAIDNQLAYAGAIVANNYGSIINCHNINTTIYAETNHNTWQKHSYAGGIAGRNMDGGVISRCSNTGSIKAEAFGTYSNTAFWSYAGGIAGLNYNSTISDCYSIASSIYADSYTTQECSVVTLYNCSGGIAGANAYFSKIIRTYSHSLYCVYGIAVNNNDSGYYYNGTIKDSYSTLGRLGDSGESRISIADLEKRETFVGFDFENIWIMGTVDGETRPILR